MGEWFITCLDSFVFQWSVELVRISGLLYYFWITALLIDACVCVCVSVSHSMLLLVYPLIVGTLCHVCVCVCVCVCMRVCLVVECQRGARSLNCSFSFEQRALFLSGPFEKEIRYLKESTGRWQSISGTNDQEVHTIHIYLSIYICIWYIYIHIYIHIYIYT